MRLNRALLAAVMTLIVVMGPAWGQSTRMGDESKLVEIKALPTAPVADIIPETLEMHGETWVDNYYWMKDVPRDKAETIAYVEAENAYTDAKLSGTEEMQEVLFEEIKSRIKETDIQVPVRDDDYYYYSRTEEGKDYPIYCRKKGSLDAAEEITLDVNELAEGREFYQVRVTSYSPNHRFLAFSYDTTGAERYALSIKDLETGAILSDQIHPLWSVVWANDNQTIFYSREMNPEVESPYQVFRHVVGTTQDEDVLIYQEEELGFGAGIGKSRSEKYLFLQVGNNETNEFRYLSADDPFGEFKLITAREEGVEYYPEHWEDTFFFLTNREGAKNYKVMRAPIDNLAPENWTEYIPHRESVYITGFDAFEGWLAVHERIDGLEKIRVIEMPSNEEHYVTFPEPAYAFYTGQNPNYDQKTYRFTYTSFITPQTVYDYHFDTREMEVMKRREVLGDFDPALYESERHYAEARDGVRVPISLVYRKDSFKKDGTSPMMLYAYGCYGSGTEVTFWSSRLSLLDRGFVYAIAHIRGGDELGEDWHDQGKLLTKKNTYYDFIDCAEYLVAEKFTSSDRLAINGASAGGMLMGVVANWRPDLFKVVVAEVAAMDVLNNQMDPNMRGTEFHYTELGNPNNLDEFEYIHSWDPYYGIEAQDYPNILVTAGLSDPRVAYWETAKYVARLRALKTDDNLLLLETKMSGHGGASGRYDFYREIAFSFAFVFHCLGIEL